MIFWGKRFGSDGMFLQEQKDQGIVSLGRIGAWQEEAKREEGS